VAGSPHPSHIGHRPVGGIGYGQFTGNRDPQDGPLAVLRELQDGLTGDPGLRLAPATGHRRYTGGAVNVQSFVRTAAGPNSDEALQLAPMRVNWRRSLNRIRGFQPGTTIPEADL
jgi:hypothetical protein